MLLVAPTDLKVYLLMLSADLMYKIHYKMSNTERTYIMIKPDGVQRGLIEDMNLQE